ncbi:MAG: glycosyltransferase [Thermodesulfobacteriota bacterium]
MPQALWWGRCDPEYSRNRILCRLFADLGWEVRFFRPLASQTGGFEALFHGLKRPDLVWVPCFRQRDVRSAAAWARKWQVPLVLDPLISAYEKEVFERNKWPPDSKPAEKKRLFESALFAAADVVVADTPAHAEFFNQRLHVRPDRLCVLYVGAEADMFSPSPLENLRPPFEIFFFGSFLQLQGADVIVKAAKMTPDLAARWVLLGDGELKTQVEKQARGASNIAFEPWVRYDELPRRIARAHILLGIFGTTVKADLVIPNKMFQAMAAGRPVITRVATAYPQPVKESDVIGWVSPGNPEALANVVRKWLTDPADLDRRGQETRRLFDTFFSAGQLREQLEMILEKARKAGR